MNKSCIIALQSLSVSIEHLERQILGMNLGTNAAEDHTVNVLLAVWQGTDNEEPESSGWSTIGDRSFTASTYESLMRQIRGVLISSGFDIHHVTRLRHRLSNETVTRENWLSSTEMVFALFLTDPLNTVENAQHGG